MKKIKGTGVIPAGGQAMKWVGSVTVKFKDKDFEEPSPPKNLIKQVMELKDVKPVSMAKRSGPIKVTK